jgi:putative transposase
MLQEQGRREVDADAIFNQLEKMRTVVTEAAAKTKKARRQAERIRQAPKPKSVRSVSAASSEFEPPLRAPVPYEVEEW